jgi:hypothetical protein
MREKGYPMRTSREVEDAVVEYMEIQYSLPRWIEGLGDLDENGDYVKDLIINAAKRTFNLSGSRYDYDYLLEGERRISLAISDLRLLEASKPDLIALAQNVLDRYDPDPIQESHSHVEGWEPLFQVYDTFLQASTNVYPDDDHVQQAMQDLGDRIQRFFEMLMSAGVAGDDSRAELLLASLNYLLQSVQVFDRLRWAVSFE